MVTAPPGNDPLLRAAGGLAADEAVGPFDPLFRPEAIAAAADGATGKPMALLPVSWTMITLSLLAMVASLAVFLMAGSYARKESAAGIVRSVGGEVRIRSPAAGVVSSVKVIEGQYVRAGDTILTVTTVRAGMDGRPVDELVLQSLDRELGNLGARLQAIDTAASFETEGYSSRLSALQAELSATKAVEAASIKRRSLAQAALERIEPLARQGFITAEAMRRRYDEVIALDQAAAEALGRQAALHRQLSELRSGQAQHPYALTQQRGQILDLIARTKRERDGYAAQHGFSLKAPASGVVTALQINEGQSIDNQHALMTISKPGSDVIAELYVPSRAVGFLHTGQEVRVRYDAFPYQKFGAAKGVVKSISLSVLRPDEVQAAIQVSEPTYRVVLTLKSASISAYGRKYRIQPGFALTGDIILEDRSFAEWLLEPMLALKGRL